MQPRAIMENYIDAFNRGDDAAYASFYAPEIELRNGAGTVLQGVEAILAYYRTVRAEFQRTITLRGCLGGKGVIAAALGSVFTARHDGVSLSGVVMGKGQAYAIESMALYRLKGRRFAAIEATTLSRRWMEPGELAGENQA